MTERPRRKNPAIADGSSAGHVKLPADGRGTARCGEDETVRQGSETDVKLMELKEKTVLSVAPVPDQVHLKVEFEIEDDGSELEIELTW